MIVKDMEVAVMINHMVNDIALTMKKGYEQVYGDNIIDIYLYGSYARGDYRENSDIDIMVLTTLTDEEINKVMDKILRSLEHQTGAKLR